MEANDLTESLIDSLIGGGKEVYEEAKENPLKAQCSQELLPTSGIAPK